MKQRFEKMTAVAGLQAMGINSRAKGPITARVLVRRGPIECKRYTARLRKGDNHLHCRLGRLVSAEACYHDDKLSFVTFSLCDS